MTDELRTMAEAIFADLLADSVLATTIEAHREIKRGMAVCATCGTRCRSHAPIQAQSNGSSLSASRESSPAKGVYGVRSTGYTVGPEKGTGGGTGVGSGSGKVDGSGNAFFDCLVCGRSITSSRYAPHLASCLGFSGSTRRGVSRMAAAKARFGANDRASPSPYLTGEDSDDSIGGKRKKLLNKRAASPSKPLAKKAKLSHNVHSGSAPPSSRPPHPPSRLGRPPISKAQSASPVPQHSPSADKRYREDSIVSVPSKAATPAPGFNGPAGGVAGKTVPGGVVVVDDGDESSEADDDY